MQPFFSVMTDKPHVLVVSYLAYPSSAVGVRRIYYLMKYLPENGLNATPREVSQLVSIWHGDENEEAVLSSTALSDDMQRKCPASV